MIIVDADSDFFKWTWLTVIDIFVILFTDGRFCRCYSWDVMTPVVIFILGLPVSLSPRENTNFIKEQPT